MIITPIINKWDKIPLCYPATFHGLPESADIRRIIEIGPGRGDFLFYLAEKNPNAEIYAVELKSKRYFKLIDRITKRGLNNVKLIQADGRRAVTEIFEPDSVNEIHINFPDPWPKRKHSKNRLVNKIFIEAFMNILRQVVIVSFISDSKSYVNDILLYASDIYGSGLSIEENAKVFQTYFAKKWTEDERLFTRLTWKKI